MYTFLYKVISLLFLDFRKRAKNKEVFKSADYCFGVTLRNCTTQLLNITFLGGTRKTTTTPQHSAYPLPSSYCLSLTHSPHLTNKTHGGAEGQYTVMILLWIDLERMTKIRKAKAKGQKRHTDYSAGMLK